MSTAARLDEGLASWRHVLFTATPEALLPLFEDAAGEIAGLIYRGIDKAVIVDRLDELATQAGLLDKDAVTRAIADGVQKVENSHDIEPSPLGVWDAGTETAPPPPRGWLLGTVFARKFLSMLIGDGAVGKTALRYAQLLSLAIGRSLTGEHVFLRCRVLIVSLEDDIDELKRRIWAACFYHGIKRDELLSWLFLAAPGIKAGKLMVQDAKGKAVPGTLADYLDAEIVRLKLDIVSLDPFIKTHGVPESDNNLIDQVAQILTDLAHKHNIAVDTPHHSRKGAAEPGDADRGRGASAGKDAGRLVYTLTVISKKEAEQFKINEDQRRFYIRMDSAKVNLVPPELARWFKLVGQKLGNATELYPNGDEVQTVIPWKPPQTWSGLDRRLLNTILDAIDGGVIGKNGPTGERYSHGSATGNERAPGRSSRSSPPTSPKRSESTVRNHLHPCQQTLTAT